MSKILYVDETENAHYFYVVGLLVKSETNINGAYKSFKKHIMNYPIKQREKEFLFNEFKSVIMDRSYQKVKVKMLECLNEIDYKIVCAYLRKSQPFFQKEKEILYISMLKDITTRINDEIIIVYDTFHKKDFEDRIDAELSSERNVLQIEKAESFDVKGLQFVDNICSSIRRYFDNPKDVYYQLIKSHVIFIK